jgi:hypothetical protein
VLFELGWRCLFAPLQCRHEPEISTMDYSLAAASHGLLEETEREAPVADPSSLHGRLILPTTRSLEDLQATYLRLEDPLRDL